MAEVGRPIPAPASDWIIRTLGGKCRLPQEMLMLLFCLLNHQNAQTGLARGRPSGGSPCSRP